MQYFTWDPAKAKTNIKKHGVSFRTAVQAFADPLAVREFDRIVAGEERWHTIGNIDGNLLLLVVQAGMTETMNPLELAALSPFATPRRVV